MYKYFLITKLYGFVIVLNFYLYIDFKVYNLKLYLQKINVNHLTSYFYFIKNTSLKRGETKAFMF